MIVEWWCEIKDIQKVRWRYAKEKGIEKFPRKLPTMKNFKCMIDRFKKTGYVKMWSLWTRRRSGEPSEMSGPGRRSASKWTAATLSHRSTRQSILGSDLKTNQAGRESLKRHETKMRQTLDPTSMR